MSDDLKHLLENARTNEMNRRDFLKAAALVGVSMAGMSSFGRIASASSGSPKTGGTMRMAFPAAEKIDPAFITDLGGGN